MGNKYLDEEGLRYYHSKLKENYGSALTEIINNGSKNLIDCRLQTLKSLNSTLGSWSGNKYTLNNIDFTVNTDGSITINGQGSYGTTFVLHSDYDTVFPANDYVLYSGNTWTPTMYYVARDIDNNNYSNKDVQYITIDNKSIKYIYIYCAQGQNLSNITIYPMFCTLTDFRISNIFVPYIPRLESSITKDEIDTTWDSV